MADLSFAFLHKTRLYKLKDKPEMVLLLFVNQT